MRASRGEMIEMLVRWARWRTSTVLTATLSAFPPRSRSEVDWASGRPVGGQSSYGPFLVTHILTLGLGTF